MFIPVTRSTKYVSERRAIGYKYSVVCLRKGSTAYDVDR